MQFRFEVPGENKNKREKPKTAREMIESDLRDVFLGNEDELTSVLKKAESYDDVKNYIQSKGELVGSSGAVYNERHLLGLLDLVEHHGRISFDSAKRNFFNYLEGNVESTSLKTESKLSQSEKIREQFREGFMDSIQSIFSGKQGPDLYDAMKKAGDWPEVKEAVSKFRILDASDGRRFPAAEVNAVIDMMRREGVDLKWLVESNLFEVMAAGAIKQEEGEGAGEREVLPKTEEQIFAKKEVSGERRTIDPPSFSFNFNKDEQPKGTGRVAEGIVKKARQE